MTRVAQSSGGAIDRAASPELAVDAAIFDRDGVLTYFDLEAAARYLCPLVPLGIDEILTRWLAWQETHPRAVTVAEERSLWDGFWNALGDEFALAAPARARLRAFDYLRIVRAYPDACAALGRLRLRGIRCGVYSNFSLPSLRESLAVCGLAELVDAVWCGATIGALKPDPRAYAIAVDELGVPPERCLFLDDDRANVEGARAAGLQAYRVARVPPGAAPVAGCLADLGELEGILRGLREVRP
jgi:putative hydrolase of the HAD superfamily